MVVGICLVFDCGGLSVVASGVYVFVCLHVLYVVALRLCSFGSAGVGWIDVVAGRCVVGFAVIWGLVPGFGVCCVWVMCLGRFAGWVGCEFCGWAGYVVLLLRW